MSFRFVHAADLHLDTPFDRIGSVPPELREVVRDASLTAFANLVDLAIARQVAFVLLVGDTFDGIERGLRAQLHLRAGLERLSAQGIQTFIVRGRATGPGDWSSVPGRPAGVTVFSDAGVQAVDVERDGIRLATVHGSGGEGDDPLQGFTREPSGGLHVGAIHCRVPGPSTRSCRVDDLAARGMDYWALGGAHAREVLSAAPWIAFAGTPQGRGFRDPELGPKGALLVSFDGRVLQVPEFVPLDAVRCLRLTVDVTQARDLSALTAELVDRAEELRLQHRGPALLLRATLTGSGPLRVELMRPGALDDLLRDLRDAVRGAAEPLWWDAVEDETRPSRDWTELQRRGDLTAELIRLHQGLLDDPERLRTLAAERFAPLRRVLPGGEATADPDMLVDLLTEAATLAIDLLEEWDRA